MTTLTAPTRRRAARIRDDAEAIEQARALVGPIAEGAAARDAHRRLPREQLDLLSETGLLAITVPAELGGADVSAATLAEVVRLLATADPSLAQIPQSHFTYLEIVRAQGSPAQRRHLLGAVLDGARFANAQSERGTRHVLDLRTRLNRDDEGWRLDGEKHYCTGALLADWVSVLAVAPDERLRAVWVPRDTAGLTVLDDWDALGQRTTASGTVRLAGVRVEPDWIIDHSRTFDGPQAHGSQAQLIHAAIDTGIAHASLERATELVRTSARAWVEAGVERAVDDPLLVHRVGELALGVRSAEALLAEAGHAVETARRAFGAGSLDETTAAEASIAVAAAKVASARAALETGSAIFELGGTRTAAGGSGLDRHWRDARTHTLHDPARWKLQHLGAWHLTGALPPRSGLV